MNSSFQLLKNRIGLIKIISLDIILYFFLALFIYQFNNLQIPFFINILLWVFFSYLLGRYHLISLKYQYLIRYLVKSFLVYLFIILINNNFSFYSNFYHVYFLLSIFFNMINKLNCKDNNAKRIWLTNDKRLENLYKSSKFMFKNNFIYLYDINHNYKLFEYEGFILNEKISNSYQLKSILSINKNLKIYSSLEWCELYLESLPVDLIDNNDFYKRLENFNKNDIFFNIKKVFEFAFSLIIFVFFLPIIIFFSILIFLQDGTPLFYSQIRTGINQKCIKIFKIRSMRVDSEKNGPQWSISNDQRITLIGKLIRKNRIDELPQLLSVVTGDLSLIGPRPERPEIDKILESKIKSYSKRYVIKPGITGWAQVNYPYGASIEDSKIKQSYDLFYIVNASFVLDLIIFFKTIKLVLNGKGAKANPN